MRAQRRSRLSVPGPQVTVPCAVLGCGPHICSKVPPGGLRAWTVHPARGQFPPLPASDSSDVALTSQLKSGEANTGLKFTWKWSLDDAVSDKPWVRLVHGEAMTDSFLMGASQWISVKSSSLSTCVLFSLAYHFGVLHQCLPAV